MMIENSKVLNTASNAATKVTLIGALLDLLLGILKIMTGMMSNSFALVSDGIHSLSDLVTDAFVLIITRISHAEPDRDHPYGHRRFETLGTVALGIVLFAVASIIAFDSIRRLTQGQLLTVPSWPALVVAIISIIGKEWIYRYTKTTAERTNSSLLLANAWHSRTDAFSSIAVLIGVLGAMLGFPYMDILAAIFVALMIGYIAWTLVASSLRELVDTALPEEQVQAIADHVNALEGIKDVHELRTRLHGGRTFIDLHVQVGARISVSEGHFLADYINQSMKHAFPGISDIVVHIDPELDKPDRHQAHSAVIRLPLRAEVEAALIACWVNVLNTGEIERLELHYLEDRIEVGIYLDNALFNEALINQLKQLAGNLPWLKTLTFYGIP